MDRRNRITKPTKTKEEVMVELPQVSVEPGPSQSANKNINVEVKIDPDMLLERAM